MKMLSSGEEDSNSLWGTTNTNATMPKLPTMGVFSEPSAFERCLPNLSFKARLIGFVGCAGVGWLLSMVGSFILIGGASPANIQAFAVLYAVGNVIALTATGFLIGPKTQCRKMWDPCRRVTTAFYLTMLIIVLAVGAAKQNAGLVIVLLIIEVMAAAWYGLSYIPFGRSIVTKQLKSTCCPCLAAGG